MGAFMWKIMGKFRNEEGEIAVEWAVLAGLIALVIVVGVTLLGQQLNALFNGIGLWIQGTLIPSIP